MKKTLTTIFMSSDPTRDIFTVCRASTSGQCQRISSCAGATGWWTFK